ncbi:uncharacterized protein M421DRAFT_332054 [Didymella exigua CBS 183.55]|uniref:Uncharacterized protein n=1 Tax=Didymella exigua CBS 183.55 TaxID=1150837 RepID=A0A6A5R7K9_9PLEO|nr:uncharacterized protein M421DRAFT_332054 [Didymella exigua CBS 183.55]KAF1923158.1 hypothetical protein M421DRAFT_332054 [Didymella exigua CBS 183.55]
MQLIHSILFAVVATALPSTVQDSNQPQLIGSDGALTTSGHCHVGQHYCFNYIIDDLRVAKQDILHQYCDQRAAYDWQSCNTCKRVPVPLPNCWDGPGVWSSLFNCTGPKTFKWLEGYHDASVASAYSSERCYE